MDRGQITHPNQLTPYLLVLLEAWWTPLKLHMTLIIIRWAAEEQCQALRGMCFLLFRTSGN